MLQTPFLQRLQPDTLAEIERRGIKRLWARNTRIFRAGDPCTGVHAIVEGLVKLYRAAPEGRQQMVLLEGNGGVLSLSAALDAGTQPVSADTLRRTTTIFIARDEFLQLYAERPDMRDAVAIEMARRFRAVVGLLETVALKPVAGRLATRLIELAEANEALDGTKTFRMVLSQDELAHALGTSRESIGRAFAELRANGVIEQQRSEVRVLDAQALFDMSRVTEAPETAPALTPLI